MSRHNQRSVALLLIGLTVLTGCHPVQPFFFQEDGDLSHYLDMATGIETPDVCAPSLPDTRQSVQPLTISNPEFKEIWDVTLQECISITLQNSKTVRNSFVLTQTGTIQGVAGRAFHSGGGAGAYTTAYGMTVYDPALVESSGSSRPQGVLSSQLGAPQGNGVGGVEAALGEFDSLLKVTGQMGQTDRRTNRVASSFFPSVDEETTAYVRSDLVKKTASGAMFTASNQLNYDRFNGDMASYSSRALRSDWTTTLEMRVDQPLLRGRGTEVNRIPLMLARINMDLSLADFEAAIQNLVLDVENTYWDLHRAYRNLETAKKARDSAQLTWKFTYEKHTGGKVSVQEEAQTREQYFNFRAQVERSLKEVYDTEGRLRYLMGLSATDGRLIRPIDEPTIARVEFDWTSVQTEALVRYPELRKGKWMLKQRELELLAAKNHLLPQLDVAAVYKWVGVGDELIKANRTDARYPERGSTAFQELTSGDFQEFAVLFNFQLPVGFRRELVEVRHRQLALAREKALLEDTELSLVHILTNDLRNVDSHYVLAQSHFNRWNAAEKEVESLTAMQQGGVATTDLVLQAQQRRAQSQFEYYAAVVEYQNALAKVHYTKGSLLEYNSIQLREGPWPQKAYWDALIRARERDASYYIDYGRTKPAVVSRGPAPGSVGMGSLGNTMGTAVTTGPQPTPAGPLPQPAAENATPENLPAPPPEPGPVSSQPGPALNAPSVRTAAVGAPGDVPVNPLRRAFEWGTLGTPNQAPAAGQSQVQHATYVTDSPK